MGKRVLLTGGTGFVGANLARRLLREGHEVHLLVRQGYNPWRIAEVRADLNIHVADLNDSAALNKLLTSIRPAWIFHLAAYGAYSPQADLSRMVQTNLNATINLVNAGLAVGFECFINTGSSSEYGFKDHPPIETEWVDPNSHYAVTKVAATQFCRYTAISQKVLISTLRLYSVYGPYEEPTRLIPTLIARGLNGELPPLANPTIARDYIYAEDVSDAYLLAATVPNQPFGAVYNLGTGVQTTLQEIVDIARAELPIAAEPAWGAMPDRQWDTTVWVADNRTIRSTLGWQPRHTIADGFHLTADWFRENPDRVRYYLENRATPQ